MIRKRHSSDLFLVVASILSGVSGAAFVLISRGALGLADFAPVAQLWTLWSLGAASLLFAYQQWAIQAGFVTVRSALSAMKGAPLRFCAFSIGGSGLFLVLFRGRLFQGVSLWWPFAGVMMLVGTILIGIARGILAQSGRSRDLGVSVAGENVIRCGLALVIAFLGGDRGSYAIAMICGFAVVALVDRPNRHRPSFSNPATADLSIGAAAFAGFLSISAFLAPTTVLAYSRASPDDVSTLFLVLTAVRFPHLLLQSGTPRAGAIFAQWAARGEVRRIRDARLSILGVTVVVALLSAAAAFVLGDVVIGIVFSIRGKVEALTYAFAAAASILSLGATVATILLVSENRNRIVVAAWFVPSALAGAGAIAGRVVNLQVITFGLVVLHLVVLGLLAGTPALVSWAQRADR